MSELVDALWERAIIEHNSGDYHEAHEIFEDIWLELDNRNEKDTVQTLAQGDALAVHIETGNLGAVQRLMRQLPELLHTFPSNYKNINLINYREWIAEKILIVPRIRYISEITDKEPPKLLGC